MTDRGAPAARAHLAVRVQPGARVAGLVGRMADGTWRFRVAAPPEDGRANRALETLLATLLGVRESQVKVTRGLGSRAKTITIDGLDDATVAARLETVARQSGADHGG